MRPGRRHDRVRASCPMLARSRALSSGEASQAGRMVGDGGNPPGLPPPPFLASRLAQRCWPDFGAGVCAWGRAGRWRRSAAEGTGICARKPGRRASTRGATTAQALAPAWRAARLICATRLAAPPPGTINLARAGSSAPDRLPAAAALQAQRRGEGRVLVVARLGRQDEFPALAAQVDVAAAHQGGARRVDDQPPQRCDAAAHVEAAGDAVERHAAVAAAQQASASPPASRRADRAAMCPWRSRRRPNRWRSSARRAWCVRRRAGAGRCRPPHRAARGRSPARTRDRPAARGWPWRSVSPVRCARSDRRRGRSPPIRCRPWRRPGRQSASRSR